MATIFCFFNGEVRQGYALLLLFFFFFLDISTRVHTLSHTCADLMVEKGHALTGSLPWCYSSNVGETNM